MYTGAYRTIYVIKIVERGNSSSSKSGCVSSRVWGCDERRTKESTESCVEANALHNISVDSFVIIIIIKDDEFFLSFFH